MFDGTGVLGTIMLVVIVGTLLTSGVGGAPGLFGAAIGLFFVGKLINAMSARDKRERGRYHGKRRRR